MSDDLIEVGEYNQRFNEILGVDNDILKIYRSKGLPSHMIKRKHYDAIKYIDNVSDIILNPTYIGINPKEDDTSIELVKEYKHNIAIGIKLDNSNGYYYVATMYVIQDKKLHNRLFSKRLIPFS